MQPRTSDSPTPCVFRRRTAAALAVLVPLAAWAPADACPFCGVVGTPLAERRDRAARVAVGEAAAAVETDAAGFPVQRFQVVHSLRGAGSAKAETITARVAGPVEGTALLFAADGGDASSSRWTAIAADETLLGYVAAAPATSAPAAVRLAWFAARLEHPHGAIAEDAFAEFGLAPFSAVRDAATALDAEKLRSWVADPGTDQRRRGFYGLALGIVARRLAATDATAAAAQAGIDALHAAAMAPGDDFRAGFDGILAGVLVAEGEEGLQFLEARGLVGPTARPLDQRHALAALRFAWEFLGDVVPAERITTATSRLLASPAVAADAVLDLARYRDWEALDRVADLWDALGADDALVRRAVAGYLTACPLPAARRRLEAIAERDPDLLRAALDAAALPAR